jgi:hypothetical protein
MHREGLMAVGIALIFYALGGFSIYGEMQRERARAAGKWPSTEAMVTEAYRQDLEEHELHRPTLLGYKYIVRGITYRVNTAAAQQILEDAKARRRDLRVQYKPEDPAVAILAGNPTNVDYSIGLGLIGFGTLIALIRELVMRRRGRFRRDAVPFAWRDLRAVLNKKIY